MAYKHCWGEIEIKRRATQRLRFTVREYDGETKVQMAVDDVARFKVWASEDAPPLLDLDSVAESANGSLVQIVNRGNGTTQDCVLLVILKGPDAALMTDDVYDAEAAIVDRSENDEYLVVMEGKLRTKGSATGDRGVT